MQTSGAATVMGMQELDGALLRGNGWICFPALDSVSEKTAVWETHPAPDEEFG